MEPILNLWHRRELFRQFLVRNVKARHRGSVLGALWLVVNPLLMLALYVFAFGVVFGGRFKADESTLDYALGVFLGLSVLGLVSGVIGAAPGIIVGQPNFVKKVVFPLEILPAAAAGALGFDLLVGLALAFVGVALVGDGFTASILWAPVIVAPVFLLALGLSWFFSALGVFVRDVAQLGGFLGLALLYASGVFYSAAMAREAAPGIWTFLKWNPLIHVIDGLRQVSLWGQEPDPRTLGYAWACGIVTLLFGAWFFHRLRPAFADVV